jgi:hypothetical protein
MLAARRVARTVSLVRSFSDAAATTSMTLNLSTPHENIYSEKVVDKVLLPGEQGEYGVTVGHSPIISQLKAGVVSVIHSEVSFCSSGDRPLSFLPLTPSPSFPFQLYSFLLNRGPLRSFLCQEVLL